MPLARVLRSVVWAWDMKPWIVCVASEPVSLPFIFMAASAWSHGACIGPALLPALAMASKKVSSIFSMLASASSHRLLAEADALADELLDRLAVGLDGMQQRRVDARERLAQHRLDVDLARRVLSRRPWTLRRRPS